MRNLKIVCGLAALLLAPTLAAPFASLSSARVCAQEAETPAQKWLTQTYAAIDKAAIIKDADAIIAWQTDDYHTIEKDGQIKTRDEANTNMKQFFAQFPPFESVKTVLEKVENGEGGSLLATETMTMKINIKGQDDKTIALEIKTRSREEWTPNADKTAYQMHSTTEIETVATADGMPVPLG